jgi:hypothetical protein
MAARKTAEAGNGVPPEVQRVARAFDELRDAFVSVLLGRDVRDGVACAAEMGVVVKSHLFDLPTELQAALKPGDRVNVDGVEMSVRPFGRLPKPKRAPAVGGLNRCETGILRALGLRYPRPSTWLRERPRRWRERWYLGGDK